MGSKWRKAKLALGLNTCLYVPQTSEEHPSSPSPNGVVASRHSDAVSSSSLLSPTGLGSDRQATTPTPSSSGLRLPKSGTKSSKKTCAICLTTMKPGHGHAIFTAECSHSFHFHCITSNVKHGNQICPVCRAKWKEVPFQNPASDLSRGLPRINPVNWPQDDAWMTVLRQIPAPRVDVSRPVTSLFHTPEPVLFDDDESLDNQPDSIKNKASVEDPISSNNCIRIIEVKTYPEVPAVERSSPHDNFSVLIHLKAPHTNAGNPVSQNSRAPVDLVTVLDVSGSMAGTKLALLKRAMGFVVQNLGPSDRLCVIAFSSTARRLFPLRRMTDTGRQQALQAVNCLVSNGGTNIAEALKKGTKVLVDRNSKNPVCSIILLSDGQDTYTASSPRGTHPRTDYQSLLPISIRRNNAAGLHIPVHTFGFGADHDAASMHSISEISGGTFSFIEAESVIQDAFAQCIGGLLSVVVQELNVRIECVHPNLQLDSIKAGSYRTSMMPDARMGSIDVGDLYAEEERDFLVTMNIPVGCLYKDEMSLVQVRCLYKDPITKDMINLDEAGEVTIRRPVVAGKLVVSMEVDRQRNRLRAAEAMAEARIAAENGDLAGAVSLLESCRRELSETSSAQAGDRLCVALSAELKEMEERMGNRRAYEETGRAYVLSGLSSHSWQRATARGDSTDSTSLLQSYQTPSMVDMVTRSQTMVLGNPSPRRTLSSAKSFPVKSRPR
ncbi:E3 ubiquitin-protein ligase WAV3-like [Argentina anserina]|uniref:E3 ubiquitin-protein ligase WAV3-like n=1 Tax=Argentina anserina TaxID=57926 RepID=UPI00217689C9|nr:E3 ubiquitin-protein ligase WAV3-like [Potentilla anserina]